MTDDQGRLYYRVTRELSPLAYADLYDSSSLDPDRNPSWLVLLPIAETRRHVTDFPEWNPYVPYKAVRGGKGAHTVRYYVAECEVQPTRAVALVTARTVAVQFPASSP
jgi:DNA primase